jgi:hypothetical protein
MEEVTSHNEEQWLATKSPIFEQSSLLMPYVCSTVQLHCAPVSVGGTVATAAAIVAVLIIP